MNTQQLYDRSNDAIKRALGKAREMNVNISIAIVDDHGDIVSLQRMIGSLVLSPRIATGKAATAALFKKKSAELEEAANQRQAFYTGISTMAQGQVLFRKGGVPIVLNGECVGGIGVSGGTPEQDEEIAVAALAAFG